MTRLEFIKSNIYVCFFLSALAYITVVVYVSANQWYGFGGLAAFALVAMTFSAATFVNGIGLLCALIWTFKVKPGKNKTIKTIALNLYLPAIIGGLANRVIASALRVGGKQTGEGSVLGSIAKIMER